MAIDRMEGARILVTGATGFVGPHLCRALVKGGGRVHAAARHGEPACRGGLEPHRVDLSDLDACRKIVQRVRPDFIFHLAGLATGKRATSWVQETLQSNLLTTVNMMVAATELGCRRLLLVGSMEEPELGEGDVVASSPYAAAKACNRLYAEMFRSLYRTPWIMLRLFMVYGPGRQDENKLIPSVISSLLRGKPPELASGDRKIDWVYVDDVVEGMMASIQAPDLEGARLDIGSGSAISIRDLVRKIRDMIAPGMEPRFGKIPDRPMEQERVASAGETWNRIGWKPKISLDEGLRRTVDWYRTQLPSISSKQLSVPPSCTELPARS